MSVFRVVLFKRYSIYFRYTYRINEFREIGFSHDNDMEIYFDSKNKALMVKIRKDYCSLSKMEEINWWNEAIIHINAFEPRCELVDTCEPDFKLTMFPNSLLVFICFE